MCHSPQSESARKIAADALLHAYDFVESLIPLYRQFQMQLVRYGLLIYTALITLIAVRVGADLGPKVLHAAAALAAYPIAFLLLGFTTTEVRIVRASRHVKQKIAPAMKYLSDDLDVLTWEFAPGGTINWLEKAFSTSISLVVTLSAPALFASLWYLFWAQPEHRVIADGWAVGGLAALFFVTAVTSLESYRHEFRSDAG